MTDVSSRHRQPQGIPVGGEFATEQRGENDDLTASDGTRERLEETLDAASWRGSHPDMLRRYRKAYANIDANPRLYNEVTRAEVDKSVERELALQGEIEALVADVDEDDLSEVRRELVRLHEVRAMRGPTYDGKVTFRIYNPRAAGTMAVEYDASAVSDDPGKDDVLDLIESQIDRAQKYEKAGSFQGWLDSGGYRDTKAHYDAARDSYHKAQADAGKVRALFGEDYSLYVQGRKPE